jgi:hypothetical protein
MVQVRLEPVPQPSFDATERDEKRDDEHTVAGGGALLDEGAEFGRRLVPHRFRWIVAVCSCENLLLRGQILLFARMSF